MIQFSPYSATENGGGPVVIWSQHGAPLTGGGDWLDVGPPYTIGYTFQAWQPGGACHCWYRRTRNTLRSRTFTDSTTQAIARRIYGDRFGLLGSDTYLRVSNGNAVHQPIRLCAQSTETVHAPWSKSGVSTVSSSVDSASLCAERRHLRRTAIVWICWRRTAILRTEATRRDQ